MQSSAKADADNSNTDNSNTDNSNTDNSNTDNSNTDDGADVETPTVGAVDAAAPVATARPSATQPGARASRDVRANRRSQTPRAKSEREAGGPRGLRDLVGAGPSQVGVSGALRARDVNRPTDEDLTEAERDVVIVRRNWKPDGRG